MAVTLPRPAPAAPVQAAPEYGALPAYRGFLSWLTTVDHKRIGILYGCTAFAFFLMGGLEALMIRMQLATPNNTFVVARRLQPAVHDARHDDDLPVRHADERRVLQLHRAAADRRA